MADFINFQVEIDAESNFSDDDEIIDDNASDKSFINDNNEINESRDFYRNLQILRMIQNKFQLIPETRLSKILNNLTKYLI